MTVEFRTGRYGVRLAKGHADIAACQALRHECFFGTTGTDSDQFDEACSHVMIAGAEGLVGTFRMQALRGETVHRSYAATSYDLSRLARYNRPMLELGRLCTAPGIAEADVIRLAWGALAQVVDAGEIGLIFGCSSFAGCAPDPYDDAFALLAARHAAPADLAPARGAGHVVEFQVRPVDRRAALAQLPPLLRSYLSMGGWVSDHAVVDPVMNTLHVFTGLETDRIPPVRAAALRALAG